jgi:glycerol-3-phosphate dehydrogenase
LPNASGLPNTVVNTDVYGVQFAAILKNIYALGAGIAHGLEYGDNFLSVFIANCADEMAFPAEGWYSQRGSGNSFTRRSSTFAQLCSIRLLG